MNNVQILKFKRYPNGSCEALVSYEKQVTVTATKVSGLPPEGVTIAEHEKMFLTAIQAEADADISASLEVADDVEGKIISDLIS